MLRPELAERLMGLPPAQRSAALRACERAEFATFARRLLPDLLIGSSLLWNWHLEAISSALMRVARGECKRLIIEAPPRSLKSILGSVLFPAYLLGHRPGAKIVCASYSQDLATKLHNDCRVLMRSDRYHELFPSSVIGGGKDTDAEFHTRNHGSRYATSPGGTLTGRGGGFLILDDCLSAGDANSVLKRTALLEWFGSTLYSRLDNKRDGAIIVIAQRLHTEDLAGLLREQGGWEILSLPAIAQIDQLVPLGDRRTHLFKAGDLLHPERESPETLDELARTLGTYAFSAQYLQTPVPIDGGGIKWPWFSRFDHLPTGRGHYVQSWDIAIKDGPTNDFSVCTTWLVDGSSYYLVSVDRERLLFPELLKRIAANARQYRPRALLIEDTGPGASLIQQLRADREAGIPQPIPCKPAGDKFSRMAAETPVIEGGQVYLPNAAAWLDEFRKEVVQFPSGRFDDQADSVSQFLHWQRNSSERGVRILGLRGR